MQNTTKWTMDILVGEENERTEAEATLRTGTGTRLLGQGEARCNPDDTDVPAIGAELAVARALADLSHQLGRATAADIESSTHQPAHVTV